MDQENPFMFHQRKLSSPSGDTNQYAEYLSVAETIIGTPLFLPILFHTQPEGSNSIYKTSRSKEQTMVAVATQNRHPLAASTVINNTDGAHQVNISPYSSFHAGVTKTDKMICGFHVPRHFSLPHMFLLIDQVTYSTFPKYLCRPCLHMVHLALAKEPT